MEVVGIVTEDNNKYIFGMDSVKFPNLRFGNLNVFTLIYPHAT